jgi:hypothetical protein
MAKAIVKNNHLHFNGKNYFRGGSEDIKLGSYGEKKSPLTQTNYLEHQSRIPAPKLKVRDATEVDIDFTKSTKADILANINVAAVFKGSSSTGYEQLKSGQLRLVKLTLANEDVKDAANASPKVIEDLIDYGNDARIATQIWVVLEAELAKSFTASKSFEVSANAGIVKVSGSGNGSVNGSMEVLLPSGMCFAYLLGKLDWDATSKKNKTRITKVTDDQWSLN